MLRSALLWASQNPTLARKLPRYGFVKRAVRRFMPGEELDDALRAAERLGEKGAGTVLTLLGENVEEPSEADEVVAHYREVLDAVASRGLDGEISVKLTQLGLDLGTKVALENLRSLVETAGDRFSLVWVDMESSHYVDATLEIYRAVRTEHENVGLCLQSYLHRTPGDLESLLPLKPAIRLVKGAYAEPPEVAHPKKRAVDAAYKQLAGRLLRDRKAGRVGRPAFGTHDPVIIGDVTRIGRELDVPQDAYEFEMLYGIGTAEQGRLLDGGYTVRILISYGEAWFPWYMRRLAERPANLWFVAKQLVG